MKKDDDEILDFVDALSVSLAEQVLEDDEALEKELRDMGQHRVEAMIERLRVAGRKLVAKERRRRLQETIVDVGGHPPASGPYDDLTRDELTALVLARTAGIEGRVMMHHRELESTPIEDLRSLLEDLDAIQDGEDG